MANTVQIKRGNNTSVNAHTGPSGEIIYNLDTGRLHAQDGSTAGGNPHALISDVDLKANAAITISAGSGLTGGGTLAASRTLALNSTSIASLAKADTAVQSVNGKSGSAVVLGKGDVGLGSVDNTSDAAKPVSTATQTALNAKANSSVTVSAGTGLTGGGNLTANRSIALNSASIASLGKADTALQAPGGGTGQILAKSSATDNDVAWVSSEAATAVSYAPQTLTGPQQEQARKNIGAETSYDTKSAVEAAIIPSSVNAIRLNGYYTVGDGGGALYKRVVPEPSHAGKIQSADGAWWELVSTIISALSFGVVAGDSSQASTNSSAIINALHYLQIRGGGSLTFPNGQIYHEGLVYNELRSVKLSGAASPGFWNSGKGTLLTKTTGGGDHIKLIDPSGVDIFNLAFSYENTPVSGTVITMTSTHGAAVYNSIKDIYISDHYSGIILEVGHVVLNDIAIYRGKGAYGIRVNKPNNVPAIDLIRISGLILDTQLLGGSDTYVGISLGDNATTWIDNSTCMQCKIGIDVGADSLFTRITNSDAENCKEAGFYISDARKIWLSNCYANVNWGAGINISSGFKDSLWIDKCVVNFNGSHGILLSNTSGGNVSITNSQVASNSHPNRGGTPGQDHGIVALGQVSNYRIIGNMLGGDGHGGSGTGTQAYGWFHNGGSGGNYIVANNDALGNSTGGLNDGGTGANRIVKDNIG